MFGFLPFYIAPEFHPLRDSPTCRVSPDVLLAMEKKENTNHMHIPTYLSSMNGRMCYGSVPIAAQTRYHHWINLGRT